MPEPTATWNRARGVWETATESLLCGHSVPYSETWPASGSMRSGEVFPLPVSVPRTSGSGCSSRPGPLLKTPTAQLAVNGGSQHPDKRRSGGHGPTLADEVEHLLPTPAARDWRSGRSNLLGRNSRPLNEVATNLLPTTSTGAPTGPQSSVGKPSLGVPLPPRPTGADA